MMSLVSSGLKHAAAVGGASGCVTERLVLSGLTRASGEEHQLLGGSVASTEGGKFEREVRCQKRYLITRIGELGLKSFHCVPIGEKFCFAGISSKIWAKM